MERYYLVAIVTLACGLLVFAMALIVSKTHQKTGILAPTAMGDPLLERTVRGHMNTVEWIPIFLPAMWLFAIYWNANWAAALGVLWIVGRIIYFFGYRAGAAKRVPGFFIQTLAAFALLFGALGRIIYLAL